MSGAFIKTGSADGYSALARRLTERALILAKARLVERRLSRSGDARRWRRPDLLWPLFKG